MRIIKFKRENFLYPEYGIIEDDKISPVKNSHSIAELFPDILHNKLTLDKIISSEGIIPLAPTDENASIFCAGLNYEDHAREMNMTPPVKPIFFTKASSSIIGAWDDIIYPEETSLLDYEIELTLIVGRTIDREDTITEKNISEYILGITIGNDISARDIQLRSGQWFLGKSFRTFAPIGPYIQVMDKTVAEKLNHLSLKLNVFNSDGIQYDNKGQRGNTSNMIFSVYELINALKTQFKLIPGDVIMTGTPHGVALSRPGKFKSRIAEIFGISPAKKIDIFLNGEIKNNDRYLKKGDTIISKITSDDGYINPGVQKNKIV